MQQVLINIAISRSAGKRRTKLVFVVLLLLFFVVVFSAQSTIMVIWSERNVLTSDRLSRIKAKKAAPAPINTVFSYHML